MDGSVILQNQKSGTNVGREIELLYLSLLETEQDRDRFQKIYEENYLKMYHVVIGILKQQADGENAVHEAFLALAEGFERYAHLNGSEMTGLCITIAKNKAIDILRIKNRYSEADLEDLTLYDDRTETNPADAQEADEDSRIIRRALRQIPDVFREALILKYYYGMKNKEIAQIQGVSNKVVEMRLYRGKQKLKVILDEEEAQGR